MSVSGRRAFSRHRLPSTEGHHKRIQQEFAKRNLSSARRGGQAFNADSVSPLTLIPDIYRFVAAEAREAGAYYYGTVTPGAVLEHLRMWKRPG